MFITSKLWNTKHNPTDVHSAAEQSLSDLGLNYLDLYLKQWPVSFKDGDVSFPKDDDGNIIYAYTMIYVILGKQWKHLWMMVLSKQLVKTTFMGFLTDVIIQISKISEINWLLLLKP